MVPVQESSSTCCFNCAIRWSGVRDAKTLSTHFCAGLFCAHKKLVVIQHIKTKTIFLIIAIKVLINSRNFC